MNRRSFIAALGALPIVGRWLAPKVEARPLTATALQIQQENARDTDADYWQGSFLRSNADRTDVYYIPHVFGTFQEARRQLWDAIERQRRAGYDVSRICLARGPGAWSFENVRPGVPVQKWRWGYKDRA